MADTGTTVQPTTARPAPPLPPRRDASPAPGGSDKPAVAGAKPDQAPASQPAADTREPAEVARAEQLRATLTGQCVRDVNGVTVLTPPRRGTPAAETPRVANLAGACSSLTPVMAGVTAAQDQPLSPTEAGALTATERVGQSHVTPETERLLRQPSTRTAIIVPGNYNEALEVVRTAVVASRDRMLSDPAMARLHEGFIKDLAKQYGDRPMDIAAISRAADELMAREILRLNNVTPENNVAGERTIAYPNTRARLTMVPAIIDQIAQNPALVPAEVATWIRENRNRLTQGVESVRDLNRAVRNALMTTMQANEIAGLIATGELPANLTPAEYLNALQRIQSGVVNELVAANAYPPGQRSQAITAMRDQIRKLRTEPPPVSHDFYRQMGRIAIERTARGEGNATFYNEQTRQVERVTPQNYTLAIQERRVESGSSTSLASDGVSTGPGVATLTEAARRRMRGEDPIGRSVVARQTAQIVRDSARDQDQQQRIAETTEDRNRVTTRRNLGDPGEIGLAALASRAENLVG